MSQLTVYATRNTEYFLGGSLCVAVRDRRTKTWVGDHPAIGRQVPYMLSRDRGRTLRRQPLGRRVGSALCFPAIELTTGRLRVIRPAEPDEARHILTFTCGPTRMDLPALGPDGEVVAVVTPKWTEDDTGRQPVHLASDRSAPSPDATVRVPAVFVPETGTPASDSFGPPSDSFESSSDSFEPLLDDFRPAGLDETRSFDGASDAIGHCEAWLDEVG